MRERVLIVEDNAALAENVAEMIANEGIEVFVASDAASAMRLSAQRGFELALVDIGLAGRTSGLDLLPQLRAHSPDGEVLLITGNATLNSALEAIRRGVFAYLPKPFEPDHLITLVKRALAQVALKRDKQALTQRLSASEALYRSMVETVEACILGVNDAGLIRFANRFAAERLGKSQTDLTGRPFSSLAQAESAQLLEEALARALAGEPVRERECRHEIGGHTRVIRWTLTPLNLRENRAANGPSELERAGTEPSTADWRALAVGIDITARLELERKAAETEAMAVMGTLTTSLAHEIRNPLNAAKLQLELLLRRAKRAEDAAETRALMEPATLVRTELDRLSVLLDDFLNLARPRKLDRRPCSVVELLESVVTLKQPLAHSIGATLHLLPIDRKLSVRADADKLKQVLLNLIGNAIEALSDTERGRIEVSAEPLADGGATISVHDNGPGLNAELLETAFQPFVTSKRGGTGLGLAIVRKIVMQHGGEVELLPRPDGGTVARFSIGA